MKMIIIAVAILLVVGCEKGDEMAPPEIHLGQDTCHTCGMIVSDPRFCAALIVSHDQVVEKFLFDDMGEMLEFKPPAGKVVKYVHDFDSGKWIKFEDAAVVKQDKIETPMGTGYVAHLRERARG